MSPSLKLLARRQQHAHKIQQKNCRRHRVATTSEASALFLLGGEGELWPRAEKRSAAPRELVETVPAAKEKTQTGKPLLTERGACVPSPVSGWRRKRKLTNVGGISHYQPSHVSRCLSSASFPNPPSLHLRTNKRPGLDAAGHPTALMSLSLKAMWSFCRGLSFYYFMMKADFSGGPRPWG